MTAKVYRRDKRRTRRRSYRREKISRIVENVLKSREPNPEQSRKTRREARHSVVATPEHFPDRVSHEPVLFNPVGVDAERIADFARLLSFVRQEAALIMDDGYCEDLLTRCIERLVRNYELAPWEHFGTEPNKSVH